MKPELTFEILSGIAALLTVLCAAAPVRGADPSPPPVDRDVYADEGHFVSVPADGAGVLALLLTGSAATLVCTPFDLVVGLARSDVAFGTTAGACGSQVGGVARRVAYLAAGAPFFVIKKLLWDAPRWAVAPREQTQVGRCMAHRRPTEANRRHGRFRASVVTPAQRWG